MSVDMLPLVTWNTSEREYVPLGLTLLPEYHAREAARFAGYRWGEWLHESVDIRTSILGHYFAHKLFAAHESDAVVLKQEAEASRGR